MSILSTILPALPIVFAIVGIIGSIIPALPGPPLSWIALLIVYFICPSHVSLSSLVIWGVVTLLVTIFDYVFPGLLTKLGGGSRMSVIGSTVGVFLGLFFMPFGLILGPLIGAFLGEMISTNQANVAMRVALMSFVAFLLTTGIKLIVTLLMAYCVFEALWCGLL